MKKLSILFLIILTATIGCENLEETERNKIRFNAPKETVEGKLKVMNNLLNKIHPVDDEMQNYFFDGDSNFYVNSQRLGRIVGLKIDTIKMFENFTIKEQEKFLSTVLFLDGNYLSSVFLDKSCKCYLYGYRQTGSPSFKNDRLVYLNESDKDYKTILTNRKILDKSGTLVLVGVK